MDTPIAGVSYQTFTDERLLDLLVTEEDRLTRAAVDEFVARGERMVEPLTRILRTKEAWDEVEKAPSWRPVHATFILGAIGGEHAIPGLLAALPHALDITCDWVLTELPSIFAAIGPAAIAPLLDRSRAAVGDIMELECLFEALGAIAARHPNARDEVLTLLRDAVRGEDQPWDRRIAAGFELLCFTHPDDRDAILGVARQAEKAEVPIFTTRDVKRAYEGSVRMTLAHPHDWLEFYSAKSLEQRQGKWSDESQDPEVGDDLIREIDETPVVHEEGMPIVSPALPGRNDPCPCGSGKKYKKCCEQ